MLTISKPLSATQAQTYHAKEFTAAEQNYWKQGDTIQGEWHGKLADRFGLSGAVSAEEFSRLSEGQHPATGEQLVKHRKVHEYQTEDGKTVAPVEHRAGWDATFSAPKSVSLTALVGGDDRVREAHQQAVNVALNELERYTQARIGGNRPAEITGQLVAAKFQHDTARPVDGYAAPQPQQMRNFLNKIGQQDKVLLIGDTRQHQGVDAGKPYEQLQQAGMQTAKLDQIVRQRANPELLKVVEHLSKNETTLGIQMLQQQGRVTEIVDPQQRIEAIAESYAAHPENTIIVSPDNSSRRAINHAVRQELQALGTVDKEDHSMRVLMPRSDMTGADRAWAARYQTGDVLRYIRGSKELGIEAGSYAQVVSSDPRENLVTVQQPDGERVSYDPSRLRGISAYREIEREFAIGDRIQLTAPNRGLQVANRDLGTLQQIDADGKMTVRMDGDKEKTITFDPRAMRHFDHGYAVTSHSSQGLTSERVLVNMDTEVHPELINRRFAYVSVSRASHEAHVYTNNAASLGQSFSHDVSKAAAVDFTKAVNNSVQQRFEPQEVPVNSGLGLAL